MAGVFPLASAAEAQKLRDNYAEFRIPDKVIERLKKAGDAGAQKKEGLAICVKPSSSSKGWMVCAVYIFFGRPGSIGAGDSCRHRTLIIGKDACRKNIHKTQPVPPRQPRIGKHGVVDWRELRPVS